MICFPLHYIYKYLSYQYWDILYVVGAHHNDVSKVNNFPLRFKLLYILTTMMEASTDTLIFNYFSGLEFYCKIFCAKKSLPHASSGYWLSLLYSIVGSGGGVLCFCLSSCLLLTCACCVCSGFAVRKMVKRFSRWSTLFAKHQVGFDIDGVTKIMTY